MAALAASRAHKGSFSCIFIRLLPLQSAEVAGALPVFQTLVPEQVVFADFSFADHVVEFVDIFGTYYFYVRFSWHLRFFSHTFFANFITCFWTKVVIL